MAGKGGSGKTSGRLARILARRGHDVLAIDGDSNPNLSLTLGLSQEEMNSLTTLTGDMLDRSNGELPAVEAIGQLADTVAAA